QYKLIVTLEEHFCAGGLGSAVAEYKADKKDSPPQLILGIQDSFGKAGDYGYMLRQFGLTAPQIVQRIAESYKEL
ncbi:MAG: hypothetical protein IK079_00815, partial [Desulfovibrio sp.]|nr:hypothetical protein [Desulfovibrio sp.]